MNIENNKQLFLVGVGLTASGCDGYDHSDGEVSNLVGMIHAAGFSDEIKAWFARARTGQVAVNPYWPRGSCLASACFFVDCDFHFDSEEYFAFLESTGALTDPIGLDDFKSWICGISSHLLDLNAHPAVQTLWNEYCRIIGNRSCQWERMVQKAHTAAQRFFGHDAPEMVFNPNLFTQFSADFVRIGNRIVTISAVPNAETMLHETMHTAIAKYRGEITRFAETYGLASFANREKMMEYGYMADESAASAAHGIEECFVRAFAVVFSGGSEERLQFHRRYGCDAVPKIAALIRQINPDNQSLGCFIKDVLLEVVKQSQ